MHLLSALIFILQLSFAISVALSLRSAWRWLHKGRPTRSSADGKAQSCYTNLQAIPGAVSILGDHDGVMDDDLLAAMTQEPRPIRSNSLIK